MTASDYTACETMGDEALRIGVDMLGIQAGSPAVAGYAGGLVAALLDSRSGDEFVLYGHDEYPRDAIPGGPRATLAMLNFSQRPDGTTPAGRLERRADANPDQLDWLLVLDPLAPAFGFGPPARPLGGLKLAAVVPELTPFVVPERDLTDPATAARSYRALAWLRKYDAILTPSQATRSDVVAMLGLAAEKAFAIGSAADASKWMPEDSLPMSLEAGRVLHGLGIRRAFLLVDAGIAGQKNVERMIEAYRILPAWIRRAYQLVFAGAMPHESTMHADLDTAFAWGDEVCFTGPVSESVLRRLYQHCSVFIHPALYAGFAQSILEAMLCGAAVVAGNNSAQAELVADAGLLVDPADPRAISAQVQRIVSDWSLRRALRGRALARGRGFTFARTATAVREVLACYGTKTVSRPEGRVCADPPHHAKSASRARAGTRPRIAFFSPLPPRISGIADYAVRLLDELKATYTIDLYHDQGYLPDLGLSAREFATYDGRLFERNQAVLNYHATVYQMGNALAYHGYLYDVLLRHPGVVTLHDFFLSVYPYRGTRTGAEVLAAFRREISHFCPERAGEFLPHLSAWCEEEGGLAAACARRSLYLNRRVFESALGVVVHSPWCLEQVRAWMPEHAEKTLVIPLGVVPRECTADQRVAIRARFGLARDALVVGSIGFIHPDKLVFEALRAFGAVADIDPSACFVCVGDECDGGAARRVAQTLGLDARVRFLGRQPAADYADLIAALDIGVSLRRPPTNGETSAALLDLLAAGVATIVTDVATFADYPDTVVRKVRWDHQGPGELRRTLRALASDPAARQALGRAAHAHVRQHHAWPRSAACYVALIERCAEVRRRARAPHGGMTRRPQAAVAAEDPS